jgi:vacuolar-type H+-ATPase subunit E/Vma4
MELRATAEARVNEILRSARVEARNKVHEAVKRERARIAREISQAEARAAVEVSQRAQQQIRKLLDQMWTDIEPTLERRWADPNERRQWIEAALRQAGVLLSARSWCVEYNSEGSESEAERRKVANLARQQGAREIDWVSDPNIAVGLRVQADGVCLAATTAGLLARREDIESAFLSEYLALNAGEHESHE